MPPKPPKSPRTKSPKGTGGASWETSITSIAINQDEWTTFVCFLTPDRSLNQIYVDLIEKAMANNVRRRFDFISKRNLLEAIKSLGKPGKTPGKGASLSSALASINNSTFLAAYEHAKSILDSGGEIDDHLWAKLIKCRILDLKKEVKDRTTPKATSKMSSNAALKVDKPKSPGGKKSPKPPAGGAKKTPPGTQFSVAETVIEKSTAVKTRDQIIDETKYIEPLAVKKEDDEPTDGPNHYIFLSGFYSIGLLPVLDDIGVRIDTITKVSCDNISETKRLYDEMIQRERQEQTLKVDVLKDAQKDSITTPEQIAQQNERNDQTLTNLWSNLIRTLDNAPDRSMLQDVIVTDLKIQNEDVPNSWNNTEQRIQLAQSLNNTIIENTFRLNIRKRQFTIFNQQMKLVSIPAIEEKTIESSSDAKTYSEMTSIIPPESLSVSLILNGILEQVETQTADTTALVKDQSSHANSDDVGQYLREKLMTLSMAKEHKKETENLVPKSPFAKATGSGPMMIYHGNDIKQRLITLNRLDTLDPIKVEQKMLMSYSHLIDLIALVPKKSNDPGAQEREARLNQWLQFCTDEELLLSDVDHALKQFVFECMTLDSVAESDNTDQTIKPSSRPSSAGSNHETERVQFERRLSNLNEEEIRQTANTLPILWDDPFESLITNEQTGRIGIAFDTNLSSATSRSSKGSILRHQTQSPKRAEPDPAYNVRFDVNHPDNSLYQQMSHLMPPTGGASIEGTIHNINQYHKRNLNDWNFAEHFEPDVFAQVIEEALFTHSRIDTYYNRRDRSQMVVLSLPLPEGKSMSVENTNKKLFSDVGFRNFLDEISYEIVDWLRNEESKYQADLLAREVQSYAHQPPIVIASEVAAGGKKEKGATGKKTPPMVRSPSVTSDSGTSTDDEKTIHDAFVYPTSLKAWKQKKDQENQETEQQLATKTKRPGSGNRSAGAKSPRSKPGVDKTAKPSTPREKSPKGGKTGKRQASPPGAEKVPEIPVTSDSSQKSDHFIGYSLGNRLLSAQCDLSHLLLPDGCFVRTRIDSLKRGSTSVSTSLHRNKSLYKVQLLNPTKTEQGKPKEHPSIPPTTIDGNESSKPAEEKRVAEFGVFTALLNSGMILSCSNYDLKPPKRVEPPVEVPTLVVDTPREEKIEDKKKDAAAKAKKKGKTSDIEAPPVEKPPAEPQFEPDPFQRLTVSIPTGLVITYYPETFLGVKPTQVNQPHRLVIKQYYACQSKGYHACEQSRVNAYEEASRIIDAEGNVIIFKRNGEVTVLRPDGEIYLKTIVPEPESDVETSSEIHRAQQNLKKEVKPDVKGKKKGDQKQESDIPMNAEETKPPVYQWRCVSADGQIFVQNTTNQEFEKVGQLRLILETNPKTTEQVIHREDKVIIVFRLDGTRILNFADGTRITSYDAVEQKNPAPGDHETGERNNSGLSFRKIPHVKIEALGYATVAFNCQTSDCRTAFGDGSSLDVFANGTYSMFECDGEKFDINENGDILLDFDQSIYAKRVQELMSRIEPSKCLMCQNGDLILDAVDYEQTQYCVEASGEAYLKENGRNTAANIPMEMHVPRFFILHEDGSGTELLRFKDLYSYLRTMDLDPSTAVVREPLLSNPKVTGATVMRPFQDEVHRRWTATFDDDSVVPQSLRNYTSVTAMTRSYSSMSDSANSLTNNNNNNNNIPGSMTDSAIVRQIAKTNQQQFKSTTRTTGLSSQQTILEMPKALDYRNFMEFPRLQDEIRMKLCKALKSYIDFVKDRADYHTKLLPQDNRSQVEKERASRIWRSVRPQGNTKDDLALLYVKTVHPDRQKTTTTRQSVVPLAKKFNLDHINDEIRQEKANKQLRNEIAQGFAVPYFKSEWGMAYTRQQQQKQQQQNGSEQQPPPQPAQNVSARGSKSAGVQKSSSGGDGSLRSPLNSSLDQQHRLSQARRTLHTRSVSTEVEDNQTVGGSGQQDAAYRPVKQPSSPRNYIQFDAFGNKRMQPIKLPNGIKGSRPNAQRHSRFLEMEEPLMARPNNASIGTATMNNRPLRERRGCELFPDRIDFGILKEGVTYAAEVEIKNVGIDACRFRIRQPPLGTGLRIVFQPGLLAAGMRRPIVIELYALIKQQAQQQSQGLYQLDQSIEIITETDIMHFPIRAKIASDEQFDIMFVNKDETAGMNKHIRLLARQSSNTNDWLTRGNEQGRDSSEPDK